MAHTWCMDIRYVCTVQMILCIIACIACVYVCSYISHAVGILNWKPIMLEGATYLIEWINPPLDYSYLWLHCSMETLRNVHAHLVFIFSDYTKLFPKVVHMSPPISIWKFNGSCLLNFSRLLINGMSQGAICQDHMHSSYVLRTTQAPWYYEHDEMT